MPARTEEKPVLENLMQLYLHEMSKYDDRPLNDDGRYLYPMFDSYFVDDNRFPFLIRVKGKLAGFVLVRNISSVTSEEVHTVAEFFVVEMYRRLGIGEEIARMVFDGMPGTWQVAQKEDNAVARAFWKQVIWRYTAKRFREYRTPDWHGPIFEFSSPGPRPEELLNPAGEAAPESPSSQAHKASQFS